MLRIHRRRLQSGTAVMAMGAATLVAVLCSGIASSEEKIVSGIVNGLPTQAHPSTGALLYDFSGSSTAATAICSGTLIGCETFLTAAHCVVDDPVAGRYFVFLQHAGVFAVTSISPHPSYTDPTFPIADVAVLKLGTQVTGIDPSEINLTNPTPFIPEPGTIVGFGLTLGTADDVGLKRFGAIESTGCTGAVPADADNTEVICWDFENPLGPPGVDSNTCSGDSGGPLFMDLGSGEVVAGITSGGTVEDCGLGDHSYDTNVYTYRSFIAGEIGGDSTGTCGSLPAVGEPGAIVSAEEASLSASNLSESFEFIVNASTDELRVGLNGTDDFSFDADLYVRFGAPATTGDFDCKAEGSSSYGVCSFPLPSTGSWNVLVLRYAGMGEVQLTATTFGGDPSVCGNDIREAGEDCDGTADAACPGQCGVDCSCPALCPVQDKVQQRCINALNKGLAKVALKQGKEIVACIRDGSKGKLSDPNAALETCLVADRKGKVANARAGTQANGDKLCLATPPCFGPDDPNTVNSAAVAAELDLFHAVYGPDLDIAILLAADDKPTAKCQERGAKALDRCQSTLLKEFNRCKRSALKDSINPAQGPADLQACFGADPKGKISRACSDKLASQLLRHCFNAAVDPALAFPGVVDPNEPPASAGELALELERSALCRACLALRAADRLFLDCDQADDAQSNASCP